MRGFSLASGLTAAALFASSALAAMDPIVIKGSKFFYKTNGTEFFIQGVAYQQEYSTNSSSTTSSSKYTDPLADSARCKVDIPLLKQLNTNTIRVYAVNPTLDHSVCMQLLQDNNIYVIADLGEPGLSINRDQPAWNDALYARYTSVVDMFSNYTNVIGFFAGNEVSNNKTNTQASAYVRAAVRDMKSYIKAKNYRTMYVGYATNDDADIRENMANYFNCGDQSSAIDFWGYNIYSWCGDSSFTMSGYDQRVKEFQSYSVPSFFAEYGCNTVQPRKFTEVGSIFGSDMTGTFSGGILYMYFQEENNYGLVDVRSGSLTKLSDFSYYSSQMAKISPTGVSSGSYSASNTPASCPAIQTGTWQARASPLPPSPNPSLCSCMYNSLSCTVKSGVNETTFGKLFGTVCGYGSVCNGIASNAVNGSFGAYSVCSASEQLSFAFDQYYKSQNKAGSACDFGGAATTRTPASPSGSCSSLLAAAGAAGTNVVSNNGASGGSSSSGSSSGGSSGNSSSSKSAASGPTVPALNTGLLGMGAYIALVAGFGASMILL